MLENIDYVKTYCDVKNNPWIARIWADMERYVETKQKDRDILAEETRVDEQGQNGPIVMLGITLKKKKPELRLKGLSG